MKHSDFQHGGPTEGKDHEGSPQCMNPSLGQVPPGLKVTVSNDLCDENGEPLGFYCRVESDRYI